MTAIVPSVYDQLVDETAADYSHRGYLVKLRPTRQEMPDFLQEFQPDLIVTTPEGDHLVVEVKARGKVRNVDWQRLRKAIEIHPKWHLKLVVNTRREEELINALQPLYSDTDVAERLRVGQQLADQGYSDSAFIIVWAALEALLRERSQNQQIHLPVEGAAALITTLTSEGELERDDYEVLIKLLPVRNQTIHGHKADNVHGAYEQLQQITQRLLEQETQIQAAA